MENNENTYDFIVTGAGSAGCAITGRLSENGKYRVLLLEAGPPDSNMWIHIPLGYTRTYTDPRVNWMFESEPTPELNNRTLYQPRGKTLGGTSSINGTVYMRGTFADYNDWRQRGCEGWDWDNVLPFFKKAQHNERGGNEFHGTGGPLRVSDFPRDLPLFKALIDAAQEAGIPYNPDFNGAQQEGVGFYQFTTSGRRRWSSARAYLKDAKARPNLTIITEAHATRVLMEEGRAVGVEYRTPAGLQQARARREVVVSGGAFGSPHLLLLSGIGPAAHLQAMGVPVTHDLPSVGMNLQDHYNTYLVYKMQGVETLNQLAHSWPKKIAAFLEYQMFKTGPLTNTGIAVGALVRTDPRFEQPDMQINMSYWSTNQRTRDGLVPHKYPGITISPVHLRPEGRGHVKLKSPDPFAQPSIQFEFLKTDYDVQAILEGMRISRKIASQPALKDFVVEEMMPGAQVTSDADMLEDVRQRSVANFHPVGTCRMGHGADAVVDPRLRVHGVRGLRVADASIMPSIIAGNTNAPSIMIGEKCAAMILEDAA